MTPVPPEVLREWGRQADRQMEHFKKETMRHVLSLPPTALRKAEMEWKEEDHPRDEDGKFISKRTFHIPGDRLWELKMKVEGLNDRAKKLDIPPIEIEFGEADEDGKVPVTLDDVQIKIPGWTFIGTIEHLGEENVLRAVPGETIPEDFRTSSQECEHCGYDRNRKDTFVVRDEDGTYRQIGRSCTKDYLGHRSPAQLAEWLELVNDLEEGGENEDRDGGSSGRSHWKPEDIVAVSLAAIRTYGYQPSSAATPTKSKIANWLAGGRAKSFMEKDGMNVSAADFETAKKMVDYFRELPAEGTDFIRNLRAIARNDSASIKHTGYLSALPGAYARELENEDQRRRREEEKQRRDAERSQEAPKPPAPTGKQTVTGRVTTVKSQESQYGSTLKMRVVSDEGWAVWVTVPDSLKERYNYDKGEYEGGLNVGDRIEFTATLTPSNDDPSFAFGSRPTKARVLDNDSTVQKAQTLVAAGLAVVAEDTGRVLLIQRAITDDDPASGQWEVPGGGIEPGEDPLDGARREWQEEVGIHPAIEVPVVGEWESSNGKYRGYVVVVPSEDDISIDDDRDDFVNPDNPDRHYVEAIAWWYPETLEDNPVVREELAADIDRFFSALPSVVQKAEWVESEHPRDNEGKFSEKEGTSVGVAEKRGSNLRTNLFSSLPANQREQLEDAVKYTPGAKITPEGVELDIVRYQKPEQHGANAIRTGVFFLPELKSPNQRYYVGGNQGYGGGERIEDRTTFSRPLVVRAASGGNGPRQAYDAIKGKGAFDKMREDILRAMHSGGWGETRADLEERFYAVIEKYGGDPDYTWEIMENSRVGNTLSYAIQEHIVAHAVRGAGYDSVIAWNDRRDKETGHRRPRLSEVFDVRRFSYPAASHEGDDFDDFYEEYAGVAGKEDKGQFTTAMSPSGEDDTFPVEQYGDRDTEVVHVGIDTGGLTKADSDRTEQMNSSLVKAERVYLKPGEHAPEGYEEQQGEHGGRYYEPNGREAAAEEEGGGRPAKQEQRTLGIHPPRPPEVPHDPRVVAAALRSKWKEMSHDEKMKAGNVGAIMDQMNDRLSAMRTHEPDHTSVHEDSFGSESVATIAQNVYNRIQSYAARLPEDVTDRMDVQMAKTIEELQDSNFPVSGRAEDVDRYMSLVVDSLVHQERETWRRQLGDHGIRHIFDDIDMGREMATEIMDTIGHVSRDDLAVHTAAAIFHDIGYTADAARMTLEGTKYHAQYGGEFIKQNREVFDNMFGVENTNKIADMIERHQDADIDWIEDPLGTTLRVSDNLGLFHAEKLPALFAYIPGALDVLEEVHRDFMESGGENIDAYKADLADLVDHSNLSENIKQDLLSAVDEIFPMSGKFTLGMMAGTKMAPSFDGETMHVPVQYSDEMRRLQDVFQMGADQFRKLCDSYGISEEAFQKGEVNIKGQGGNLHVKVVGIPEHASHLFNSLLKAISDQENLHLPGQHNQKTHGRRLQRGSRLAKYMMKHGGITYDYFGNTFPSKGKAVAVPDAERVYSLEEFSRDPEGYMEQYVAAYRDVLDAPGTSHHLGGWVDKENGQVYLDLSVVVENHAAARRLSIENKQEAYYDLGTGKEYRVRARDS